MAKKIGLFGGTFDPIHEGHLNLACEMQKKHNLDEIWFIPAHVNPHKNNHVESATIEDRLAMVKLATKDHPGFIVKDFEALRAPPSYTVDTIRHFLKEEPSNDYYLIMGQDTLSGFTQWREPEEIVKLVPLLIGSRQTKEIVDLRGNSLIGEAVRKGLTQTRLMNISATEIRQLLSQGKGCSSLVPKSVLDYIHNHNLYT